MSTLPEPTSHPARLRLESPTGLSSSSPLLSLSIVDPGAIQEIHDKENPLEINLSRFMDDAGHQRRN
jgi:hypothetical protein